MIDYEELMVKAERLRNSFGEDNNSPIDIFALAQSIEKLTLVFYPMGENISGMCVKGTDDYSTIAINSEMSLGRQRSTLAHEFYHLFYDDNMISVCSKAIGSGNETERKADAFALYFLMPRAALETKAEQLSKKQKCSLQLRDVVKIEQYFGVSHQLTVYQLKRLGYISQADVEDYIHLGIRKLAESMGYSGDLYRPLSKEKQYRTYGAYIGEAEQLLEKELISEGKYEELLLEAFRDDLVYGYDEGGDVID